MKSTSRILTVGAIVSLIGLSGCVWDPGMRGEHHRYHDHDRQGNYSQYEGRDRNGQPCDTRHEDRDNRRDDDCRSR